jgi:hypothetical protein
MAKMKGLYFVRPYFVSVTSLVVSISTVKVINISEIEKFQIFFSDLDSKNGDYHKP